MNKFSDSDIHMLFPVPIGKTTLFVGDEMNEKLFSYLSTVEWTPNEGNVNTKNNYLLDLPQFEDLKNILETKINDYFHYVYKPSTDCSLFITQSWINKTMVNEYHHKHQHPNSFLSGVLYLASDMNTDRVEFFDERIFRQLDVETKDYTILNSKSWWFPVNTNDLLFFPSWLPHMVKTKEGNSIRLSLAFNTFLKGVWGDNNSLTEMKL